MAPRSDDHSNASPVADDGVDEPPPAPAPGAAPAAGAAQRHPDLADLIDEPLLGLSAEGTLLAANRSARTLLERGDTLAIDAQARPWPVDPALRTRWEPALEAARAGHRRLLWSRAESAARSIVVRAGSGSIPVLVRIGRDPVGRMRAIGAYAQAIGLSPQETRVLEGLVAGERPESIARRHRVALATVRTQVRSMVLKSGLGGMRELVAEVARVAL